MPHIYFCQYFSLFLSALPVFQVHFLSSGHLFKQDRSRKYHFPSLRVAEEWATPFTLPASSFLYSVSLIPSQDWGVQPREGSRLSFYLEVNGYVELVLTLSEREAHQAASSLWNWRGITGGEERRALTSGGGFHSCRSSPVLTSRAAPAIMWPPPPAGLSPPPWHASC